MAPTSSDMCCARRSSWIRLASGNWGSTQRKEFWVDSGRAARVFMRWLLPGCNEHVTRLQVMAVTGEGHHASVCRHGLSLGQRGPLIPAMDSVHPLMPAPQPTILRWRRAREPMLLTGLAAVYFVAAKLGLRLAFVHASATPVWPNTGLALAALLILGARVWPAPLVGAFVANLTTARSVATSLGIAAGHPPGAVAGGHLVSRL